MRTIHQIMNPKNPNQLCFVCRRVLVYNYEKFVCLCVFCDMRLDRALESGEVI